MRAYGRYFTLRSCYDLEFSHTVYDEKVAECTFLGFKIERLITRLAFKFRSRKDSYAWNARMRIVKAGLAGVVARTDMVKQDSLVYLF